MLILSVDTAAAPCCVAVYDTQKQQVLAYTVINNKLTHSVSLMPTVDSLLKNAGIAIRDIDLFAAANGPGSFTGLRIGISAVKGMAAALGKPCAAVSTLMGIAYGFTAFDCIVCACLDARCNQVYSALFKIENGRAARISDEECLKSDEAAKRLSDLNGKIILAGDGAPLVYEQTAKAGLTGVTLAPDPLRYQNGFGVCIAAQYEKQITPGELMPMYLKIPQAQRELLERTGGNTERKD